MGNYNWGADAARARKTSGHRDPTSSTGFRNLDGEEMRDPAKLSTWEKLYIYGVPAAMTAGGALGVFPAPGATAAAGGTAATTAVPSMPWTIPAGFEASMAGLPAGATAASVTAATTATLKKAGVSDAVIHQLTNLAKDPRTYAGFAALLPSLLGGGGGNSPFGGDTAGLMDEARKSLELQRHRVEQAQPVYDTLVNMSYGMSPKAYRGKAPDGYTPNAAPEGAYEMRGPQFGRNG